MLVQACEEDEKIGTLGLLVKDLNTVGTLHNKKHKEYTVIAIIIAITISLLSYISAIIVLLYLPLLAFPKRNGKSTSRRVRTLDRRRSVE